MSGVEKGLAVALEQAEEVISLLLDHAPHTWSLRILRVGRVASILPVYSSPDCHSGVLMWQPVLAGHLVVCT